MTPAWLEAIVEVGESTALIADVVTGGWVRMSKAFEKELIG